MSLNGFDSCVEEGISNDICAAFNQLDVCFHKHFEQCFSLSEIDSIIRNGKAVLRKALELILEDQQLQFGGVSKTFQFIWPFCKNLNIFILYIYLLSQDSRLGPCLTLAQAPPATARPSRQTPGQDQFDKINRILPSSLSRVIHIVMCEWHIVSVTSFICRLIIWLDHADTDYGCTKREKDIVNYGAFQCLETERAKIEADIRTLFLRRSTLQENLCQVLR